MPNISFDIFFDNDVLNFTATRSGGVPKVKPGWKVRTAPKLPPKPKTEAEQAAKPNRPPTKALPKPTVQGKSAPPVTKPPVQTIKATAPKTNGAAPKTSQATNGVKNAASKA